MNLRILRRCREDLQVPAEKAIQEAVNRVEEMEADPDLTEAVILLGKARDKVSDYVDRNWNDGDCANCRPSSPECCKKDCKRNKE